MKSDAENEVYRKFLVGPVAITDGWMPGYMFRRNGVDYCDACGKKWAACKRSCQKLNMEED